MEVTIDSPAVNESAIWLRFHHMLRSFAYVCNVAGFFSADILLPPLFSIHFFLYHLLDWLKAFQFINVFFFAQQRECRHHFLRIFLLFLYYYYFFLMMVFFPPLLSVVKCKRILYEFCFWVFRLSVWMWSLSLLKWFTGSLTLCRNFLLVCRFCFVCLLRRVFYLFFRSLSLLLFSSQLAFILSPHYGYIHTHTQYTLIGCERSRSFAFIAPKKMLLRVNM